MDVKEIRRMNLLLLVERHGSVRALADATDSPSTYLVNIKNKERAMGDELARRIEKKLDRPHGWMDRLQVPSHRVGEPGTPYDEDNRYGPGVPVVGTAQLGDDGYWHELEYPAGHGEGFVRYPMRDENTYALRVKGDSMWPRIKPGEFVIIEPNSPVTLGEEVMVQTSDGRSMIKLLVSRRGGLVELHSVNGAHKPITLDEKTIAKIHHVAGILKPSLYYEKS
jgi:phage repressor protein C with HTH and peptisase S24 domain